MSDVIVAQGLTKYFGEHRGVIDLDFTVSDGEVFGFLGPNGAGKSTTIRLLLGLYAPTRGDATLFGENPRDDEVATRRRIGYLPGELALHPRLDGDQHLDFAQRVHGLRDRSLRDELVRRFEVIVDRPTRTRHSGPPHHHDLRGAAPNRNPARHGALTRQGYSWERRVEAPRSGGGILFVERLPNFKKILLKRKLNDITTGKYKPDYKMLYPKKKIKQK